MTAGNVSYLDFFSKAAGQFGKRPPALVVAPALTYWAGLLEEVRGLLFNREPMVTRQSARQALQNYSYDSTKAQRILGISFRPLEESLSWCCADYMRNVKANK